MTTEFKPESAVSILLQEMADLPADQRTNALIAERIFGWTFYQRADSHERIEWHIISPNQVHMHGAVNTFNGTTGQWIMHDWFEYAPILNYSSDIAAAWKIVEKLHKEGCRVSVLVNDPGHPDPNELYEVWIEFSGPMGGDAATAPLAICRAALRHWARNSVK